MPLWVFRGVTADSRFTNLCTNYDATRPGRIRTVSKQKDLPRQWAAKARNVQAVMLAGIAMIVAGVLIYLGWWTKAALALVVGPRLAQTWWKPKQSNAPGLWINC